jgi:hypothetical protein
MVKTLLTKVFGSRHERERKRVQPIVDEINGHGERLQSLTEAELQGQTAKFRAIIHERTDDIEAKIAELKERKPRRMRKSARQSTMNSVARTVAVGSKASCATSFATRSTNSCRKRSPRFAKRPAGSLAPRSRSRGMT